MNTYLESITNHNLTRYIDFAYGNWSGKVWQHDGCIHARIDDNPAILKKHVPVFLERQAYRLWFSTEGIVNNDTLIDKLEAACVSLLSCEAH